MMSGERRGALRAVRGVLREPRVLRGDGPARARNGSARAGALRPGALRGTEYVVPRVVPRG
ncbi:hypothetical protein HEK616_50730 [Streptomyces nigrescens]|uniref:Uncharacterized protein n=1 Tax=Streptomyces nigrescens TaxID=1920 RepID=A0ABM7ZYY0_STRNI|nr:hypothetical protein HEK616_50730 [Streptomyces nigrescens]